MKSLGRLWDNPGPDRGWSWLTAICCSFLALCTFGVNRAGGVLYINFLSQFDVNREAASWPFSLCMATSSISSVATAALGRHFSIRSILFTGGSLATLAFASCFFATSMLFVTVAYGLVYGFSVGLILSLLPVILNQYFDRFRTTANGILLSGGTIGGIFLPPLLISLFEEYGFRGTFLLYAAIILHALLAAQLLRPRDGRHFPSLKNPSKRADPEQVEQESGNEQFDKSSENPEAHKLLETETNRDTPEGTNNLPKRTDRVYDVTRSEELGNRKSTTNGESGDHQIVTAKRSGLTEILKPYFDVMVEPAFHVVNWSNVVSICTVMTFNVVIVDYGIDVGISSEKAVLLVTVGAFPDLIGRAFSGFITDYGLIKRKNLLMLTRFTVFPVMILLSVMDEELVIFFCCAAYGILEGIAAILGNVLAVEYLGTEKLSVAFSLMSFSTGASFIFRSWLIGIFRDKYGSYKYIFIILGAMSLSVGLIWIAEPLFRRKKARRNVASL